MSQSADSEIGRQLIPDLPNVSFYQCCNHSTNQESACQTNDGYEGKCYPLAFPNLTPRGRGKPDFSVAIQRSALARRSLLVPLQRTDNAVQCPDFLLGKTRPDEHVADVAQH